MCRIHVHKEYKPGAFSRSAAAAACLTLAGPRRSNLPATATWVGGGAVSMTACPPPPATSK